MTSPPQRKSTSKSPPILPAGLVAPAPRTASTASTSNTSTSDIGILRLSGQISQNDDRLPMPPPSQLRKQSSNESGGSGPQNLSNISASELPFLDESPANYAVGHPYTQGSASSSASSSAPSQPESRYARHTRYESVSQTTEVLSDAPEHAPEGAESSFSHSHHSDHSSFSVHNTSDESGSSNKTNSSFLTNSSGSASLSRSSDSQNSDFSFSNAETSTPRITPARQSTSQKTTPSIESDPSSQQSPVKPITYQQQRFRIAATEVYSKESGSSQSAIQTIPENEVLVILDNTPPTPPTIPTLSESAGIASQTTDAAFGTDPSIEEIDEAWKAVDDNPTQELVVEGAPEDDMVGGSLSTQDILTSAGLTPPVDKTKKRGDKRKGRSSNAPSLEITADASEYLSSDDDEASRSTLSNRYELHMSQSQANITMTSAIVNTASLPSRSRRGSGASKAASVSTSTSASVSTFASGPTSAGEKDMPVASGGSTAAKDNPSDIVVVVDDEVVEEHSKDSVSETQDIPDSASPGILAALDMRQSSALSSQRSELSTPSRRTKSRRSPHPADSNTSDLPSSQSSDTPHSSSDAFLRRLRSVASQEQEEDTVHVLSAASKRRRLKAVDDSAFQVTSSISDEEFWAGGSDRAAARAIEQAARSRSGSQDISSFPEEWPSDHELEQEDEEPVPLGPEAGDESQPEDGPSTPTRRTRSAQAEKSSSRPELSPRPRTSQSRELRRRGSSQSAVPAAPTRRTLRRIHSTTEALRAYKINDTVWARWRRCYYAGVVVRKDMDLYDVHFLDDDISSVDASQMRPLKLRLGAEVMARKSELKEQKAIVEGVQMAPEPVQSRVDVRFEDDSEANLSLQHINLTTDMMAQLDKDMDWDQDTTRSAQNVLSTIVETSSSLARQSSSISAPPSTPRKNKGRRVAALERSLSGPSTPNRRGRTDMFQSMGSLTPSRRGANLFKDLMFILSLSAPGGGKELDREISLKIKTAGGTILNDVSSALDAMGFALPNVLLISFTTLRTTKYIEALALNIPRLSYRWIESCCEDRQLLPYQSYLLPTGFSKELDTIVSSTPHTDRGIFDGLQIGLCGATSYKTIWERPLKAAGATVVNVTAKSGPKSCNYIVFSTVKHHQQYCESNVPVPSLSDEWLIQCLINQRVMAINGHPSYTEFAAKAPPGSSSAAPTLAAV
ncbi:hypothetical protein BGZ58_009983 [Dissophora ornata]|nr:hypothetical protein BGZ58_009983 [Dissophora ornata]